MDQSTIEHLVRQPESASLEFKVAVPPTHILADNLAAFANTRGGHLIIGVDEANGAPVVTGISDFDEAAQAVERAADSTEPKLVYNAYKAMVDGKKLYVVAVPAGIDEAPFLSNGRILMREGSGQIRPGIAQVKAATAQDIAALLSSSDRSQAQTIQKMSEIAAEQTAKIIELEEKITKSLAAQGEQLTNHAEESRKQGSWPRMLFWAFVSALIGAILGAIVTLALTNSSPDGSSTVISRHPSSSSTPSQRATQPKNAASKSPRPRPERS